MFNFSIPPRERKDMLCRLLVSWALATVLTFVLTADGNTPLMEQVIYSFAIATLLWFFIDVGDFYFFSNTGKRYPFTKKRYLFVAIATVVANYCGFFIGDTLTGWTLLTTKPSQVGTWALLELVITVFSVWFYTQQEHHKEDRRLTYEARLRLLESQLEPHMMFNTLANLRALVQTDPTLALQMLDRIVDYMRATLGGSRANKHALSVEFARIDDYLDLMKLRMGARLEYELHLSPNLADYPVPPFILQPLVENAIKHGLEPKVEGGRIVVNARILDDEVVIDVSDTGVGSDAEELSRAKGFGIKQVTDRLAATYGDKGTIIFIATEAYNTLAKVTFPYNKELETST
jgi:Histidine kinase